MGDAGEGGEAGGDGIQLGRGDGGDAECRAVAEAARVEHRAEPTHETLRTAIVQEADHVSFFASDFIGKRLKRTSA